MQHDEFIGQVRYRAHLSSRGDAERATRATLQTLADRLVAGAADNLASQLPPSLGDYLAKPEDEAERHAHCVIEILQEAVTEGQIDKIREQLPDEWDPLFRVEPGR